MHSHILVKIPIETIETIHKNQKLSVATAYAQGSHNQLVQMPPGNSGEQGSLSVPNVLHANSSWACLTDRIQVELPPLESCKHTTSSEVVKMLEFIARVSKSRTRMVICLFLLLAVSPSHLSFVPSGIHLQFQHTRTYPVVHWHKGFRMKQTSCIFNITNSRQVDQLHFWTDFGLPSFVGCRLPVLVGFLNFEVD